MLSNLDIFFDKSIEKLKQSGIADEKAMFCLLRYECKPGRPVNGTVNITCLIARYLDLALQSWQLRRITVRSWTLSWGFQGAITLWLPANVLGYKVYNTLILSGLSQS